MNIAPGLYPVANPESIRTPALAFYPHLIRKNLERMLELVRGRVERLCPHVKTHKTREIVRLEVEAGITRHKCATLREAQMLAEGGASNVTVAYPLLGPWINAFFVLQDRHPGCVFTAMVDSAVGLQQLAELAKNCARPVPVLVDVDVGMHRTGAPPKRAVELARAVDNCSGLEYHGLHCYDGHLKDPSPEVRRKQARQVFESALSIADELERSGITTRRLVMGGTPTFPFYAECDDERVECSPGTCILHDIGYGSRFPDLGFTPAAIVLSRVISHPGENLICLDCGYKAVAADQPTEGRLRLAEMPEARLVGHSEEHAVLEVTSRPPVGAVVRVLPGHICPTVAHYDEALVLDEAGALIARWPIAARSRSLDL